MRTRIKICGVTEPDIAQVAVAAGADAIGLIFHAPSKRNLELPQAAAIARAVAPFVTSVAVMVNPTTEFVRAVMAQVQPSCLQFHGEESAAFCAAFGAPYIKALRVTPEIDLLALEARYATAQGILLDTHTQVAAQYGGSGATFDWQQACYGGTKPLLLAGGLCAENITAALAQVAPYGVDVSTGVESAGRKDAEKIRHFCQHVFNFSSQNT